MNSFVVNLKHGIRLLWKNRAFTATVALTLAVCIGANTAIFAIVNSVLLKPLPIDESDRIMFVSNHYPGAGVPDIYSVGIPDYIDRRSKLTVFEEEGMYRPEDQTIELSGVPQRVKSMRVTPSLFRVLRSSPAMGRIFTESEGELGNDQKVILSYGLWNELFGGNPSILGQTLRIGGRPFTIVGVMPRGFTFLDPEIRFWTPYAFTEEEKSNDSRHSNNSSEIGRLKPEATIQQAQAQVDGMNAANLERFPNFRPLLINAGFYTSVRPLQDVIVRDVRNTLYLLWGGAAVVLLIGGVNIGNLVLARSSMRRKELATRLAMGATRIQLAGHLLAESIPLGFAGGIGGLGIGAAIIAALGFIGIERIPRAFEIQIDAGVVAFALGVSLVVGVVIGLVPLVYLSKINLSTALREETRTGTGGRASRAIRRGLVVAQVALAYVLLIGAGLLLASFRQLLAVDPGFRSDGLITISTAASNTRYPRPEDARTFMNRTLEVVRAIPGVQAAGATDAIPFGGNVDKNVILAEGYRMKPGESLVAPMQVEVSAGYFEAMGTRLKLGRFFNERDTPTSERVALVDERLAQKFWPGENPVGRKLYRQAAPDSSTFDASSPSWSVVGVVEDVRLADLPGSEQPLGTYYFSMNQSPSWRFTIAVKSAVDAGAVAATLRNEMRRIDPDIPLFDIKTMDERTRLSLMPRRAALLLGLTFGAVALFLAAIGIYGVLTYLVSQRRREIGIRIALGSSSSNVFRLILQEGAVLVLAGLAVGLAGTVGLRSFIETQLFNVRPLDPWILSAVVACLAGIALAACAAPARGATRVDPVRVLNE